MGIPFESLLFPWLNNSSLRLVKTVSASVTSVPPFAFIIACWSVAITPGFTSVSSAGLAVALLILLQPPINNKVNIASSLAITYPYLT